MFSVYFIQDSVQKEIGLLEDQAQLEGLIRAIEEVCPLENIEGDYFIHKKDLPDYGEIHFHGHKIPLSQFEFPLEDDIYIQGQLLRDLSQEGQGYGDGYLVIENYAIPAGEVQAYIRDREAAYQRVKSALEDRGFQVSRSLQGSEDGEAIVLEKEGCQQWYFAALDPAFVADLPQDEQAFQAMLDDYLQD